jgi:hypothetical protein
MHSARRDPATIIGENHVHSVAIHSMRYDFSRTHQTLRCSSAMAVGVTGQLWGLTDMVQVLQKWKSRS